ncbi:hypothetical protein VCRA2128O305_160008 [Vibrio crassostreae]|nr:hypothetical protein VCHA43P275_60032 [Vibrio chagasii]CAK1711244.1 hypothetical protein VCRA2112O184_110008 [Vibrio crassostreae]CAH7411508.1 hypothetical protein VCHA53O473_60256 [Vibrio chagasii]CAK1719026.1 hypothetical protein VCRA2116O233_110124 [Vibrio crassostreae]CAK1726060.1 hypothetical protein VCRA2113O227_110147 [Vibrio crassostreae]
MQACALVAYVELSRQVNFLTSTISFVNISNFYGETVKVELEYQTLVFENNPWMSSIQI